MTRYTVLPAAFDAAFGDPDVMLVHVRALEYGCLHFEERRAHSSRTWHTPRMTEAVEMTETWLRQWITAHGGVAGTVHQREGDDLRLAAAVNIPPHVVEVVRVVPKGKGMAGLALERDAPVSTCNLQTDATGDVRPGARAVDANAAVAIPVHDAAGAIRGVVGIAYLGERAMDDSELAELTREAEALP